MSFEYIIYAFGLRSTLLFIFSTIHRIIIACLSVVKEHRDKYITGIFKKKKIENGNILRPNFSFEFIQSECSK